LLVNSIIRSSTLETPIKQYIERSGVAFERTTSENAILRKENTEFRELLRVYKERKKGKRVAIKGKFIFSYLALYYTQFSTAFSIALPLSSKSL